MRSNLAGRAFWLIVGRSTRGLKVFTVGGVGEVLPVFSFEEEAEMFCQLGLPEEECWRVRETTCGELASVLHAPCRDIGQVVLDPLPETVGQGAVGFASLGRSAFIGVLLTATTLLTGSIFPAMAWHTLNNALALFLARDGVALETLGLGETMPGFLLLAVSFWILWRTRRPYPGLR